jgi:hypothetical protein
MLHHGDFGPVETYTFTCPKCGRSFSDWKSCRNHAIAKRPIHARFCSYDLDNLPRCLNSRSYLQVSHEHSGHCDLRGRRKVIEDMHAIHLQTDREFYSVLDGHNGNFASKFVASTLFETLQRELSITHTFIDNKERLEEAIKIAFKSVHSQLRLLTSINGQLRSGTTATILYIEKQTKYLAVASLGDSRAVLSNWYDVQANKNCSRFLNRSERCLVGWQLTKE